MPESENRIRTIRQAVSDLVKLKDGAELSLGGLYGSARAFFLATLFKGHDRPVLAVLPTQEAAEGFASDLRFFLGADRVLLYPSTEVLPFELEQAHQEIQAERMRVLFSLTVEPPCITVSSADNLMQRVMPASGLGQRVIDIKKGAEVPLDGLVSRLQDIGYSRMSMVEERGEMSLRGGILDIFAPMHDAPLRIEFFGDEVESIRSFDVSTQRSLKELQEARILPAREASVLRDNRFNARERLIERADSLGLKREAWEPLSEKIRSGMGYAGLDALLPLLYERLDTVFDYLMPSTVVAVIDPELVEDRIASFAQEVKDAAARLVEKQEFHVAPGELYLSREETDSALKSHPVLNIESLRSARMEIPSASNMDIRQEVSLRKGEDLLAPLADRVKEWTDAGVRTCLTAHNRAQAERTREILSGYGLNPSVITATEIIDGVAPGFSIAIGSLQTGFRLPGEAVAVVSEEEVFGERVKRRPPPSKKLEAFVAQLQDLSPGDFIVHSMHGVGVYRGLKRLSIDGVDNEFLLMEYRDGDKLYLPVLRMDLVSKYHGVEGEGPELDKLGGPGWERKKKRVKQAVEKLAGELLKLYAEREVAEGFAFSPPDRTFHEFEAGFEYEETPDQARAIEECLKDMEEPRPMDRLICGDVGYGKTEVAIRAAFKAVLDKKQVAVLVPTTVLAQQHFRTFCKRLAPYPVVVDVLSRFRSKREQKDVVDRLARGLVDIVIGTHRLLQKDIEFKDLGLIVIDEEHRFGVAHKERFKQMRKRVDVLTLTATPIPRTLHMSLASIRELSIINTPPEDRLAVKTSVIRFDETVIAEAVERELHRGGQVFFVHNRIESMGKVEEVLRRISPHARVAVAHGQMREGELEKKMLGFVNREYDVLLSTAIVESGLDIPSANTIIINRADRFGLADLYQLRGRVGRSSHRAYAYFICPPMGELTDDARKRIEVIQELCEPGSGFKVATYDLEIRGAGELLGAAQSGQIAEVGFDLYAQLLEDAVNEIKGTEIPEEAEPEINLRVSQYIPEEYVPDTRHRLSFYKRLASVRSEDELDSITEELADRYGDPPALVNNLASTVELKLLLKRIRARELTQKGDRLFITFGVADGSGPGNGVAERAMLFFKKEPKKYRITPDSRFIASMGEGASPIEEARYILKELALGCYS